MCHCSPVRPRLGCQAPFAFRAGNNGECELFSDLTEPVHVPIPDLERFITEVRYLLRRSRLKLLQSPHGGLELQLGPATLLYLRCLNDEGAMFDNFAQVVDASRALHERSPQVRKV